MDTQSSERASHATTTVELFASLQQHQKRVLELAQNNKNNQCHQPHVNDVRYTKALSDLHHLQETLTQTIVPNRSNEMVLLYGAKQVVLDGLVYQTGSELVQRSKHITGLISLPLFMFKKYAKLKNSNLQDSDIKLNVSNYVDYMDAERPKNHLSYKLGMVLVGSAYKQIGFCKMLIQAFREFKVFNQSV